MKITDIKVQQKRSDRVSIYVDGRYSFSLSVWQVGSERLRVGDDIDEETIASLKRSSETGKLYDKTLNWLLIRPRSDWEVQDYLARKTNDEELRLLVLKRVREKGFIDDHDFAQRWIAHRRLLKPMSTHRIRQELLKKRVPRDIIDQTLSEDETEDLDTVKQLIQKRRHRYKDEQKLMAYLARQGYAYATIKQALEELSED